MIDLILDVEATCEEEVSWHNFRSEVIEIGMYVPLRARTTFPGYVEYQGTQFVRPVIHPTLTEFCKGLTTIRQDQVDGAPIFRDAMDEIDKLCQRIFGKSMSEITWASWGFYDLNILRANARWLQSPVCFSPERHVNIKEMARRVEIAPNMSGGFNMPGGALVLNKETKRGRFGLQTALEFFGLLPFQGTQHRGIDDAFNIGRIWNHIQHLFDEAEMSRHLGHSKSIGDSTAKKLGIAEKFQSKEIS